MKNTGFAFIVITASLTVSTESKHRKQQVSESFSNEIDVDPIESGEITSSLEYETLPGPINFNGALRKSFAMEAALHQSDRNLICSPLSALLPLGKLVLGTERGKSRSELLSALGYSKSKVKTHFRSIIENLKYLPGVTLSIASVIYVSQNKHLQSKYHNDSVAVFGSTVQKINFENSTKAADIINKKVFDSTHGKIEKMVSPNDISPAASVILVNAIYFAGRWKLPFKDVKVDNFYTPSGVRKVPMMSRRGYYFYAKSDAFDAQIIEIFYEGEKASFIIVLPSSQNGLPSLLQRLKKKPELLNKAISKMQEYSVLITIPKFRIESDLYLDALYEKIGVRRIFIPDKSGLKHIVRGESIYVSKAVQKAYIEVTEKGTEAAAATATMVAVSALNNRAVFKADRPFLFFIRSGEEQLFAGIFASA